ncbi:MAG: hypothetical protein Q8N99_05420 [Nanoarchaeota archaeon]|nr:hypothetical protein [Nanoarchaeota archaeon]
MANEEEKILDAIKKIRASKEKKNFDQSIDLIINLKNFDVRKEAFSTFIQLPNKVKNKNIAGFLEKDSKIIATIKKDDFPRYKDKKDIKKLVKQYDFFIASAKLMPSIATSFGRVLGPAGKMPSPQLGIITSEDDASINAIAERINSNVKIRIKEPSIKISIGKESLSDDSIMKNILAVYHKLLELLPKKNDNIRNVKIKLTMGKPVIVEI